MTVFNNYSLGLATGRDAWCYSAFRDQLIDNATTMIGTYEAARNTFHTEASQDHAAKRPGEPVINAFLDQQPQLTRRDEISWNSNAKQDLAANRGYKFHEDAITTSIYRPFYKQHCYFHRDMNARRYQLPTMFPTPNHANTGFYILGLGASKPFSVFMMSVMPDLNFYGSEGGQFFPRWTYLKSGSDDGTLDFADDREVDEWGYRRVDNITDEILTLYRGAIGGQVDKDDIFYYVYGVLHGPAYRTCYAADLKKMLPHIPTPDSAERFTHVAGIGRQLAELHLNYEEAEPYPLDVQLKPGTNANDRETWRVDKMRWRSKTDKSAILYNGRVTIAEIPDQAHDYLLGSRTALEWLIDRYRVKTDKASGIVNDPNIWCDEHDDPTYIVDLIKKVTTVSVETVALVGQLCDPTSP